MSETIIQTPPISHEVRRESNLLINEEVTAVTHPTVSYNECIVILDAGSQYSKVIDRRIRELNVASEIHPMDSNIEELIKNTSSKIKGIIISGGPESVYSSSAPKFDKHGLFELNHSIPILGICYGMQLMNFVLGGKVEKKDRREDGVHDIIIKIQNSLLFKGLGGLDSRETVLLTHGDSVTQLADGFHEICESEDGIISGIENVQRQMYGVQFHPEVDLSLNGKKMLQNFLVEVCHCSMDFTLVDREKQAIDYINGVVGKDKKVLVLVSGGVDSTVCAALISKAIGPERVIALHIDNGFMRKDESNKVEKALGVLGLHLIVVDASQDFYDGTTTIRGHLTATLKTTLNPEEKRKIIGDTFMRVAEVEVKKLGLKPEDVYLAQGTLRPDLIESSSKTVSGTADVIKTHHNDTELVRLLRDTGRVIEPLADYHKDEVRELGKSLGLPEELVWRQPFPGPGLAIRILCTDKPYLDKYELTKAVLDYIINGEKNQLIDENLEKKIQTQLLELKVKKVSNIRSILFPVQTVGVQGDGRTYSYLVGLYNQDPNSNIESQPWTEIFQLAKAIPKLCHNINRIVFVFNQHESYQSTNITPTCLSRDVIDQLQHADSIVNDKLLKYNLIKTLSQVPVVLLPIDFGTPGNRCISIRTFITNDFMTGVPATPGKNIPFQCLNELSTQIPKECKGISRVFYDITSKPPATTEYE